ncbi:hypothetical protein EYV94_12525 [Puteibacter caeruleilacunae]|nr:hypothetical protein EYV94_12525 [Puteibacter caeruleilacunae]
MRQILVLLVSVLLVSFLSGCKGTKNLRLIDASYEIGEYTNAIDGYKRVYKNTKDLRKKTEIAFNLGECYRKLGQYSRSVIWYRTALRRNYADPVVILRYADALKNTDKIEQALEMYQVYMDSVPESNAAIFGIKSCQLILEQKDQQTRYRIDNIREINSSQSDYAGIYSGKRDNEIIFTSSREQATGKKKSQITGHKYADLFTTSFQVQKQKWGEPKLLDEDFVINTGDEDGAATLSAKGDVMLFTRCRYNRSKSLGAEIYKTSRSRGDWSEPVLVELVGDSLIAAHPSVAVDGTLYFVSDRPGGFGGTDIWMAERSGGSWSKPVNMGSAINTEGNEVFPYIRDNGDLYFSSDMHPGLGGLDIFKATKNEDGEWEIENMLAPVNSPGDDFGISYAKEGEKGLFTSNRKGSRGDDIYSFVLPPKIYQVFGEIYNKETEQKEKDATVRIIGTDGTMLKMRSMDGKFKMKLNPGTEYIFASFKDGFLNAKKIISTVGLDDSKEFNVALEMTPTDAPIKVDNINYEFGKWDLLQESVHALDSLVDILEQNPTITIELMSHTDFVGSDAFNSELSQKRAQAVVDFLIKKGIDAERLVAKGYGETWPKKITRKLGREYDFLKRNDVLTEEFINGLSSEQEKEICNSLNRRTEFRVLSTDYHKKYEMNVEE